MKANKTKIIIILVVISVLLFGTVIFNIYRNKLDNYFNVETTIEKYSSSMSQLKGFPFKIVCNNNQKVTITITDGYLFDDNDLIKHNSNIYVVNCNQTVYWNFMYEESDIKDIDIAKLYFKSSDKELDEKKFTLSRDDDSNYSLISN